MEYNPSLHRNKSWILYLENVQRQRVEMKIFEQRWNILALSGSTTQSSVSLSRAMAFLASIDYKVEGPSTKKLRPCLGLEFLDSENRFSDLVADGPDQDFIWQQLPEQ